MTSATGSSMTSATSSSEGATAVVSICVVASVLITSPNISSTSALSRGATTAGGCLTTFAFFSCFGLDVFSASLASLAASFSASFASLAASFSASLASLAASFSASLASLAASFSASLASLAASFSAFGSATTTTAFASAISWEISSSWWTTALPLRVALADFFSLTGLGGLLCSAMRLRINLAVSFSSARNLSNSSVCSSTVPNRQSTLWNCVLISSVSAIEANQYPKLNNFAYFPGNVGFFCLTASGATTATGDTTAFSADILIELGSVKERDSIVNMIVIYHISFIKNVFQFSFYRICAYRYRYQ